MAAINRSPFFGKLKFLSLNTIYPLIDIQNTLDKSQISGISDTKFKSDPTTEYSLYAAFGIKIKDLWRFRFHSALPTYSILLSDFYKEAMNENSICIVNLKGFSDTWVPRLTGHWDPIISNTSRFYEHNGYRGKKLAITLDNQFKNKCIVLADKELPWDENENFRFHSPNLNFTNQQEDAHILQFRKSPTGKIYNILIDVGMQKQVADKLLDYLAINEIFSIDEIFITHPHKDHYDGLWELIKFGIPIHKVWMNLPKKENCDKEIPWGCDYGDLLKLQSLMKEKGIQFQEIIQMNPKEPIITYRDDNNVLSILYASPPVHPQLGNMDTNDLSLIMKLTTNEIDYLFTGDLNKPLSNFLKDDKSFRADILKVPHHGTEGVAVNEFLDMVDARIGIVPAPAHLWCSERSSRIRNYFKDNKTKMYISGFSGDILIRHFKTGKYKIKTELEPEKVCE
ncbi:MAG: MBL fold metallo-hydrolase [Saprospirales bacterium]|nr:MBL fold metallo-hydrolase [Saprospirales bacterium]